MRKLETHEHLTAALDECAAALRDIETLAEAGQVSQGAAALAAILARSQEARGHVLDIIDNMGSDS